MEVWFFVLQCFYFMLPAYWANMAPVMFKNAFRSLAIPIDNNIRIRGKSLFGSHKTVRGFMMGILLAMAVSWVQSLLYRFPFFSELSFFDYGPWALLGFLMGAGALGGDLLKSVVKRQLGIPPGEPFIPFDQLDFVIGALIFTFALVKITWQVAITSLLISFVLHIVTNHVAFWLKIREEKW